MAKKKPLIKKKRPSEPMSPEDYQDWIFNSLMLVGISINQLQVMLGISFADFRKACTEKDDQSLVVKSRITKKVNHLINKKSASNDALEAELYRNLWRLNNDELQNFFGFRG